MNCELGFFLTFFYFHEQEHGKNTASRKSANKDELDIIIDAIIGTTRAPYIRKIANAFIK